MRDEQVPAIPGAAVVSSWYGRWPSFHDAEVLELSLKRSGISRLRLHAWNTPLQASNVNQQGYLRTDKHAVVVFEMQGITDLELSDFSPQNVLAGLTVANAENAVRITLHPAYGLGGRIDAKQVTVMIVPGRPAPE